MKIAQIAPIIERVPPKKYGGTERVVYALTEELVKRGHDVTLFATGDSITSGRLISVCPKALKEIKIKHLYGANAWTMLNIGLAYSLQDEFDIIHDHNNDLSLPTANIAKTPVIMTIHGVIKGNIKRFFESLSSVNLVSISYAQREPMPDLNYVGNVYHGLEMKDYPFSRHHDGYLLYVGRISHEKGVHNAITVAKKLNLPLIIAAKLETAEPSDVLYFHKFIKPHLSDQIRWIGEVDENERNKLMSKAMAFLHLLTWREPFGLALIEAMACGTPVFAFNKGSMPEIITEGVTGFIVEDLNQAIEVVKNISKFDRFKCRQHAIKHFSPGNMTDGYEEIYRKVLSKRLRKQSKEEIWPPFTEDVYSPKTYNSVYAHQISLISGKKVKH